MSLTESNEVQVTVNKLCLIISNSNDLLN